MNAAKKKSRKPPYAVPAFLSNSPAVLWVLLFGITLIFTIFLYPEQVFIGEAYHLGDVVEKDIKAPIDFFIEDTEATDLKRKNARNATLTVYDFDNTLLQNITSNIDETFSDLRAIIRDTKDAEPTAPLPEEPKTQPVAAAVNQEIASLHERIWQQKEAFEKKLEIKISNGAYQILENEGFSENIAAYINQILTRILENGVVANKEILLKENDKGITLKTIGEDQEKTVYTLKRFYGLDQAKAMVRIIGDPFLKETTYAQKSLIVDFAQRLIHPNITLNRSETELREQNKVSAIKPVLYKIKAGEMLLREGERVTEEQLQKLKSLKAQTKQERFATSSIGTSAILIILLICTYFLHIRNNPAIKPDPHKNIFFIACVLILFFFIAIVFASFKGPISPSHLPPQEETSIWLGIPMTAGAMIICLFMGFETAIPVTLILALLTAIIFNNRLDIFLYFLINGSMAAYWIQNSTERKVLIKAGFKIGCLNIVLATAIMIYLAQFFNIQTLFWDWFIASLGGIGAGIITAGIAPLIEIMFNYTTDITLLELANFDQPILRRLMLEAPGTYNHSVIVGTMAEAAANEIDANPMLARVCGYYHDIGKIKKPLYFIENQANGRNRHDKLAPSMSALILIAHLKKGVEIAKKYKLGDAIIDTIKQHHGTSIISFFYDKAKQQKGEDAVNIDDFRYPGPKPQTREAAIVLLADTVEAASRTLENPTPARIQGLVQNLINKIFSDGQLDNCELTLKDLHCIAKSFNKLLSGIYHHRIEYPDSPTTGNGKLKQPKTKNGKGKNGNSDKHQSAPSQNPPKTDGDPNSGRLKRLGIS